MAFLEILKDLVGGVKGAVAATIMCTDGLHLEKYQQGDAGMDVDVLGIEYSKVIDEIKTAASVLRLGSLEEIVVTTAGAEVLLRLVTPDYYMVFVMNSNENVSKARYLLGRAALKVKAELQA